MKRAVRKEQGRVDILQAAAALMARRGYHGMSMRDLARETGTSLANLYNYFASKEDVLFALQGRAFETLYGEAEAAVARVSGAEARLHAFILTHIRYVAEHRDVMRVLVEEAGELPARRRQAVRALKERYFQLGLGLVRARVARAMDEIALERATYCLFGMLNWTYGWYAPERHGSPQEVARTIHGIALAGLDARDGGRTALGATERLLGRVAVRSPVHLHPKGDAPEGA